MGSGSTTFIWYFLCCGFVVLTALVATGLVVYGNRRKRIRDRERALSPASDSDSPVSDHRVDPRRDDQ